MLGSRPFMQLIALTAAIPTGAETPSLSVNAATTLASVIYDLPDTGEIPGIAEQKREIDARVSGKLKILNPGRDREIDQYFVEAVAGMRNGCIAGVRTEIAKRLKANFSPKELNSLTAFSETTAGSSFFYALRKSAYGSDEENTTISDSADTSRLLDSQSRSHFTKFYESLMANTDHWIRVSCELGQAGTDARLTAKLQNLNLKGFDKPTDTINTQSGFHETDDPRYKRAVSLISRRDFIGAQRILTGLSTKNNISAKTLLATLYYQGDGIPRDLKTAFELFKQAATAHDVRGEYYLAAMYSKGQGTSRDPQAAFEWTLRSAEAGYPPSELSLAETYHMGDGVQKDLERALLWYQRSADDGFAPAQYKVGVFYRQGFLVAKDYKKAADWFEKAAKQGNAQSAFMLGSLYEGGQGVSRDYSRSFQLFNQAASSGFAGGQYGLGAAYFLGHGTPRNSAAAVDWYTKAAAQGYAAAQFSLGACFANGDGVAKDMTTAVRWYLKAANQGHGGAQFNLGFAYGLGQGVPVSPIEAYKWFALSASRPETEKPDAALFNRDHAAAQMTPVQIQEAKALIAAWRPNDVQGVQAEVTR